MAQGDDAESDARAKIRAIIRRRGLGGLANDTKWKEFIAGMRALFRMDEEARGFRPSWRFMHVDGRVLGWDVEWRYHLPNMIVVEWLDVTFLQEVRDRRLPPTVGVIDHAPEIVALLERVGLELARGKTMIRVFGYAPKSMELFDE